ncbi:MAG: methylmalonyl-CoA mutase [Dehalococcoidia bacterium]|nr:MAG: methylmalonyl-CoA mutase [Dehalococcoidia bacterium]
MFDREKIEAIKRNRQGWEEEVLQGSLEALPESQETFTTISGLEVKRLYTPEDISDLDYVQEQGFPGQYPFTRGIHPTMYRARPWTMRMFSGLGSAEDTNQRFKYLLEQGESGLSVAFDFPTIMGYCSDNPAAYGECGKCGVAIDTLKDMEILFEGIPLDRVTTSMTINPPAAALLAMYIVTAEKQGVTKNEIQGTIQNDMLKEFIAQKTFMLPPGPSLRIVVDTMEYCTREVPSWNTISISGYHIREAGSTAVQELAFTLADGLTYVQACIDRGMDVDEFAPRLSFFFNAHIDFFEEIAKYRAARRMWAKFMRERFQAKNPRSWMLRFHTQTAGCSLTAQQPYNNVVRTAYEALAAVLGGTQSLHTNSADEVLALPSEEAVTIALRTQQILAEETGVINTIDPLAGSYFVESLTDRVEEEAMRYIDKIEAMGGMLAAIEKGYPQREIADAAYRFQQHIDTKKRTLVGVNKYVTDHPPVDILKIDPEVERKQVARLQEVKQTRDNREVEQSLEELRRAAEGQENLMPYIIECVRGYATLQEICDVLREVFGTYRDPGMF